MTKIRVLKIGEIVARTGLTERAIRHYETCGLIAPERSASGQRLYDAACVERLSAIQILRRANFSIPEIEALLKARVDACVLVGAQIERVEATIRQARASLEILRAIARELETGVEADLELLCRLVQAGEQCAPDHRWREVFDRYFTPERQAAWTGVQTRMKEVVVDPAAYNASWAALAADIKAALPLDPASQTAQSMLDRWEALLAPFNVVADARQKQEAAALWSRVGEWGQAVEQPVTQSVVDFIKAARQAREEKRG